MKTNNTGSSVPSPTKSVTVDQEVCVRDRIRTAIDMARRISDRIIVPADNPIAISAIEGILDGATWETIRTLGLKNICNNIRSPYGERNDQGK